MNKKTACITDLTRDEVRMICQDWSQAKSAGIGESLRGGFSDSLSGTSLNIRMDDGSRLLYQIDSSTRIYWSTRDTTNKPESAQILELQPGSGLFLINHLRSGTFPLENITLIVDVCQGQATLFIATLGSSPRPRDVERTIAFGTFTNGSDQTAILHRFSAELVGKIIDWHYDRENLFIVKHLYINNAHMVYHIIQSERDEVGLVEAAECDYIKIRENVCVMSWLEKGHQGMQGVALIDLAAMHDVGSFFGISILDCLENYTFAADGQFSDLGKVII